MEHKNPIIKLYQFRKIIRLINTLKEKKLSSLDKKAIRGVFVRKLKDYEEDDVDNF